MVNKDVYNHLINRDNSFPQNAELCAELWNLLFFPRKLSNFWRKNTTN